MIKSKKYLSGILLCFLVASFGFFLNYIMPVDLLGTSLITLILGILLNPVVERYVKLKNGINWVSKRILRTGIILTGISLSFSQVFQAGKYALILMIFTLTTSFGVGYICQKVFKINWKLSSLLSVSTAICGGTAVATLGPTIEAEDKDIAYAISATFVFDLLTVILFPWIGRLLNLSDTGYGLWIGTSVNDTSSVVAAGYAFSDAAGSLATIVKLTRTLFIVPIVIVFSWIYAKKQKDNIKKTDNSQTKINYAKIFPWFILGFLIFVGIRSTNILNDTAVSFISNASKFFLAMALGAIGMKTSFKDIANVGIKPMFAGIIIDVSVVIVSLIMQGVIVNFIK